VCVKIHVQAHTRVKYSSILYRFCIMTLKCRLEVTQRHWKWHHSIDRIRVPIRLPSAIATMALSCVVSEIKRDIFELVENRGFFESPFWWTTSLCNMLRSDLQLVSDLVRTVLVYITGSWTALRCTQPQTTCGFTVLTYRAAPSSE